MGPRTMDEAPNGSGRFKRAAVKSHLALHHPRCPEHVEKHMLWALRRKKWNNVTLGQAVGIILQTYARHHLTNYDSLYKIPGITQEEARIIVRNEVADIIRSWGPEITLRFCGSEDNRPLGVEQTR